MTFDEYVAVRGAGLLRFAAVLTGERGLAEDVLQEVLTRAYLQWERVGAVEDPHAYVRRMIVNEYLSWRRKWQRITPLADVDDLMPAEPDHAAHQADRADLLQRLRRLPRAQRATIVLRYYEGLADEQIAEVLGTTAGTVRSNVARGLRTLRVEAPTNDMLEGERA